MAGFRAPHPGVTVVVPTLDEERAVHELLPRLLTLADEVVVCDGGSTDDTVAVAKAAGARVVTASPGRGSQLNHGAAAARRGDVLLFLHADTRLPDEAIEAVRAAVRGGAVGGGFLARFDSDRSVYSLGARIVNLRTRLSRSPLGDQAQFATRRAFDEVGGFSDWPILEDLDFIRRLKRIGRLAILAPPVVTSARRFEKSGIARTVATNWLIFALYFLGVPAERLERLYRQVR